MEKTDTNSFIPSHDLNEDTWVPFNDNQTETPVKPVEQPVEQQQQQYIAQPEYYQQPYMHMLPPSDKEKGIAESIKEVPVATLAVIFGIGLIVGFMFSGRRPIILNGN